MGVESSIISLIAAKMFSAIDSVEEQEKKLTSDRLRFNLIALADRLHLTIAEAEQMPLSEFNEWMAYFNLIGAEDG